MNNKDDEYVPEVNIEETAFNLHENWFQASIAMNDELVDKLAEEDLNEAELVFLESFQAYMKFIANIQEKAQNEVDELFDGTSDISD